jgi:IMP dehydrogenase
MKMAYTFDDVLLVPKKSSVQPKDAKVDQVLKNKYFHTPLIGAAMDTCSGTEISQAMSKCGVVSTIHRNLEPEDQLKTVESVDGEVWAAIGVGEEHQKRAKILTQAKNLKGFVVDSAHGHSDAVLRMVSFLRESFFDDFLIVGGNVCTAQGALDLISAGSHIVKVGQGAGAACTTRLVAGIGIPQFTAIQNVVDVCDEYNIPLIADGGIKNSGDIVKALAAGADLVMLGSIFASAKEAPGHELEIDGVLYKHYRGMGSQEAMTAFSKDRYGAVSGKKTPEGTSGYVTCKGAVAEIVESLLGGLRAGMGYLGASNIAELRARAEFVCITESGKRESHPHSMLIH